MKTPTLTCPECSATRLAKSGLTWRDRKRVQRWRCLSCGRVFTEPNKDTVRGIGKTPKKSIGQPTSDYLGHRPRGLPSGKPSKRDSDDEPRGVVTPEKEGK